MKPDIEKLRNEAIECMNGTLSDLQAWMSNDKVAPVLEVLYDIAMADHPVKLVLYDAFVSCLMSDQLARMFYSLLFDPVTRPSVMVGLKSLIRFAIEQDGVFKLVRVAMNDKAFRDDDIVEAVDYMFTDAESEEELKSRLHDEFFDKRPGRSGMAKAKVISVTCLDFKNRMQDFIDVVKDIIQHVQDRDSSWNVVKDEQELSKALDAKWFKNLIDKSEKYDF